MKNKQNQEAFYADAAGRRHDAALHEPILANPGADRALAAMAIKRALALGCSQQEAERLFGPQSACD